LVSNTDVGGDRRGHDHMIVRVTTTGAICAYHHSSCQFEFCSGDTALACVPYCAKTYVEIIVFQTDHYYTIFNIYNEKKRQPPNILHSGTDLFATVCHHIIARK
jgi:hypothetical protein